MPVIHPILFLLATVFFVFIGYHLGKDLYRMFISWFLRLKARRSFLMKGAHRSLPAVLAVYFSSLLTLILYTYTMRHQVSKDHQAFATNAFVFIWVALCYIRIGIVFSERGNLLRLCTLKEQLINTAIWLLLFTGILYLLKDLIQYPSTYYIVITMVAIIVTLGVIRFRNVKNEKYPDRAGLLKSKRVTLFRTASDDTL